MKKIIAAVVFVAGMALPTFSFAQTAETVQLQALYQSLLKQVVALLEQEVAQLEIQLAAMNVNQNSFSSGAVACTQEAKLCPGGSYVSRSGPACEFAACPESSLSATTALQVSVVPASTTSNSTFGVSATSISQIGKMPLQKIGTITIGASSAGPIQLASLKLAFSGNGYAAGSSTFLDTVFLKDPNAVDVALSFGALETEDANAGTISWTFPPTAGNPPVISSGERLTLQLWGATDVIPGILGTSESLSAVVQNPEDLTFYDGADPVAISIGPIPLSITAVPISVASLSWGVGM